MVIFGDEVGEHRRVVTCRPHLEEVSVLVEDLYTAVLSVGHEDPPVSADSDAVHRPEFVRPRVVGVHRRLPPVHEEVAVGVELGHSGSRVAIGHEEGPVG